MRSISATEAKQKLAAEFQAFCDRASESARARGMTKKKLDALLSDDESTAHRR